MTTPDDRAASRGGHPERAPDAWHAGDTARGREALRVGDGERDAVALALHEHFAAGRLDRAELDERLDAALAAKTLGDLREVVRDLPEPSGLPAPEREPAAIPAAFGPHGRHAPGPLWVPGRPPAWVGAGHPAWRHHHARRRAVFPLLAIVFGAVALTAGVGTALLTVFHVVMVLWILRAVALLVHTRRHRRALR
ncbi:DUF1707 SHOCT-like domain-containing protein [Actinomadura gamaensis]|uniref:DUF1707 domain-containing protein n=1 Tax=Actinomadura gamaensis TaxID=1763541 RepID=A0ABV9U981_9ACTN